MLDFSLSEIAVVGTIALVVLGPERLPGAARTAGRWLGKARRFATQMQQELASQLDAEALRKELSEHQRTLDEQMQETRQALAQVQRDTKQAITGQSPPIEAPRDRYALDDTPVITPWTPAPPTAPPPLADAPRPIIAAHALRPLPADEASSKATTRNADES